MADLITPIGPLWLVAGPRGLRSVLGRPPTPSSGSEEEGHAFRDWARQELAEYFAGRRRAFTVPLDLQGVTAFTRRVLEEVRRLPFGTTATYGDIARRLGARGAARAVGRALAANPLPILIPCHRVVRADGTPGGYSAGLAAGAKERLLALEGASYHLRPG